MIDKSKVYKYLGFNENQNEITKELSLTVDSLIQEISPLIHEKYIFSTVLPVNIEKTTFLGSLELSGNDIKKHLKGATSAVLFGATLGLELDRIIRKYEQINMTKVVIIDAIANVLIEDVADRAENEYRENLKKENLYLTCRYSPGYGDLPLSTQNELINLLDAPRKIGLTVTKSGIMIPRKSITAILGISNIPVSGHLATCSNCVLKGKCEFRKRGKTCY